MSDTTSPTTVTKDTDKGKGKKRPTTDFPPPYKSRKTERYMAPHKPLSYQDIPKPVSRTISKSSPKPAPPLTLTYHRGNIFSAPPTTLLIHACNVQGSWGAGIALAFKKIYPEAYILYHAFCTKTHNPKFDPVPTGTALLIPPVDGTEHWIGCLFTSAQYGRKKDKSEVIVRNTELAMEMLLDLVGNVQGVECVRMCKINSGKFDVKWERTEEVLKGLRAREGGVGAVEVWEPEE